MLRDDRLVMDGVSLARSIRAVALQARRTLRASGCDAEKSELLRAIDRLRGAVRPDASTGIARWLDSLRHRVERHQCLFGF